MALSTVQDNNKLIKFIDQFTIEYFRQNRFSAYSGTSMTSIIRVINDLKSGGEQLNIPLLAQLTGKGKGAGTLVGNEESLDDYGMRAWIDWLRNAITMKKNEKHKQSADAFAQVKPLLSTWGKGMIRDETIEAFMTVLTEAPPVGLGSDDGDRVNGLRYESASAAQRNTWHGDNSDRVLYGNTTANFVVGNHAGSLANVDATNDLYTAGSLKLMKYMAKTSLAPKITPTETGDQGREFFVAFSGSRCFRDLQTSLDTIDKDARSREGKGMDNNPLFQDGDELYRGVVAVEISEIDEFVDNVWTTLLTAGAAGIRVNPVFFCGQSAVAELIGQMPRPTFRKEDDYGFIDSAGVEMAQGFAKIFRKTPKTGTALKQFGLCTGFFASTST